MRRNCSPLVIGMRMSRMIALGRTLSASSRPASALMARGDLETLELEHPREGIGDRSVVVHDQDCFGRRFGEGALGRGNHRIILKPKEIGVKQPCYGALEGSLYTSRPVTVRYDTGFPGGYLSPILVRPVREQLEHDRVIRLLQAKLKRKHDVAINVGDDQTAGLKIGPGQMFPDLVLTSQDKSHKLEGLIEVETGESVNHLEAMAQWAHFGRARAPFYLYVPAAAVDIARRLCVGKPGHVHRDLELSRDGRPDPVHPGPAVGRAAARQGAAPKASAPKRAPERPRAKAAARAPGAGPGEDGRRRSRQGRQQRPPRQEAAPAKKPKRK